MIKNLPTHCPSCSTQLQIKSLQCPHCSTRIEGDYNMPLILQMDADTQQFIISFVKHSGSLKQMAKELGLSYPTVRNRLDEIIAKIGELEK